MKRRSIIAGSAASWLLLPRVRAQAPARQRPARIGWPASVPIRQWPSYAIFVEAMRGRGWIEGTHYVVDEASYDGRAERIPAVVAELIARQPDLIIGSGSTPMPALIKATRTIPIVMFGVGDPVGQGFVASLARPGGNLTGVVTHDTGILAKQLELLVQAAPTARRVGVLFNPEFAPHAPALAELRAAAARLGVQLRPVAMRAPGELEAAVQALQRERVDALHIMPQPFLNTGSHAERLATLSLQQRWPSAMVFRQHARAGILLSYGWEIEDQVRRLPHYVIRILEGTPPGELSAELPTLIYLTINLRTARALGLTLPQSLLLQAHEVIE